MYVFNFNPYHLILVETKAFDESESIILTTTSDLQTNSTKTDTTTLESLKTLALETTTEVSTTTSTSTSTSTTTTTKTEEGAPSITTVPVIEASFVTQTTEQKPAGRYFSIYLFYESYLSKMFDFDFLEASFLSLEFPEVEFNSTDIIKLDQEIIVETTTSAETSLTTTEIPTTEDNSFRVSMSSEIVNTTEPSALEKEINLTEAQESSTLESKLTTDPSDPIVPFEFLSTITNMGMGLVPVSSTEAILKPTKNPGQKTTTAYDWTHIFSEEYQKGK